MPGIVRLTLAYDGTRYHGWQIQPGQATIQGELEQALLQMTGLATRVTVAGRTDAGVHARGQVAAFTNESRHPPEIIREGLNSLLPEDIAVLEASQAPEGFDPRRDAAGKHYRYTIHNQRVRPVLERRLRWHIKAPLDVEAMRQALSCLVGRHDFSAFRAADCQAGHPVRTIDRISLSRRSPALVLDVFGNGFLKQMVRNIVGSCVEIGRGRWPADKMRRILDGRDRTRAGKTAPARGLCMMMVYYNQEEYRSAIAD